MTNASHADKYKAFTKRLLKLEEDNWRTFIK